MKIALITGANRGLGFETSKQLARLGFKVYMAARDQQKGQIACDILKAEGLNVCSVKMDVTKTKEIRDMVDMLKANNEIPDVIINNAGVFLESSTDTGTNSSVLVVDPVIILKTIEVNTMGPLKLFQALVPLMKTRGSGRIINISSGMGQLSTMEGNWPGYRISKTALNSLTRILHSELLGAGIYVNSVCPGWVRTDMGGKNATKSIEDGVETTVWLATMEENDSKMTGIPSGKFFREKQEIDW